MKKHLVIIALFFGLSQVVLGHNIPDISNNKVQKKIEKISGQTVNNYSEVTGINSEDGKFYKNSRGSEKFELIYIGTVRTCNSNGCDLNSSQVSGKGESFDYLIFFNKNREIERISILSYNSSYGYEICSKAWLKQFYGKQSQQLKNDNFKVDAISGATVSVNSITRDLVRVSSIASKI